MAIWRNVALATTAVLVLGSAPLAAKAMKPSGTITIDETQFGFLVGGSTGGGKLIYKAKTYDFKIGGISVGNIGVSKIKGSGKVYDLKSLEDFPGTYTKLEASATFGKGEGVLRVKNDKGVVLEIDTKSGGLQLTAGAGGVKIKMK